MTADDFTQTCVDSAFIQVDISFFFTFGLELNYIFQCIFVYFILFFLDNVYFCTFGGKI